MVVGQNYQRHSYQKSTGEFMYNEPRQDINAPDLYIPTMAFVTYVLMCGIVKGLSRQYVVACFVCCHCIDGV